MANKLITMLEVEELFYKAVQKTAAETGMSHEQIEKEFSEAVARRFLLVKSDERQPLALHDIGMLAANEAAVNFRGHDEQPSRIANAYHSAVSSLVKLGSEPC